MTGSVAITEFFVYLKHGFLIASGADRNALIHDGGTKIRAANISVRFIVVPKTYAKNGASIFGVFCRPVLPKDFIRGVQYFQKPVIIRLQFLCVLALPGASSSGEICAHRTDREIGFLDRALDGNG
jgi:hypothetical protein